MEHADRGHRGIGKKLTDGETRLIATAPDVEWATMLMIALATNLIFPVVFYPFSKTIWMVFDLVFMKKLERRDSAKRSGEHRRPSVTSN